jgi:hypothetical protein
MRVFTLMARRSFGLTMLAAMVGIVLLHIFARERPWTHEWFWAAYQLNFVTVMLAPVVAGVAAWEGVRFARGRTLLETSNRVLAGLLGIWAALLVWVFLAYAIGLALVVVMVKLAGTPGLPELDALVAVIPALALLAAAGAIGLAIGWMVKNPLAAPACAVGCFLLILLLYLRGPGQLVIVGGATDSLLALRPRPELQAAQVLCYLACSFAALVLAAHTVGGSAGTIPVCCRHWAAWPCSRWSWWSLRAGPSCNHILPGSAAMAPTLRCAQAWAMCRASAPPALRSCRT